MKVSDINMSERPFVVYENGEETSYKTVKPTFAVGNKADLIYKKAFSEALKEGLLTAFQMKDTLDNIDYYKESGSKVKEIDAEIDDLLTLLPSFEGEKDATPTILKVKELRARRIIEVYKINNAYDNTAESYAETLRNQFYAAMLTQTSEGKRVWNSFEEFQSEMGTQLLQSAIQNVMLFNARIKDNFEMEYAENEWMVSKGILDTEGNYIKKDEEKEEEVKEADKAPKKTKKSSKKSSKKTKIETNKDTLVEGTSEEVTQTTS